MEQATAAPQTDETIISTELTHESKNRWPIVFGLSGDSYRTLKFRRRPALVGNPSLVIPEEFSIIRQTRLPSIRLVSPKRVTPANFNLAKTWERYTKYTQAQIFSLLAWSQYHQHTDEYLWKIMERNPDVHVVFLSHDDAGTPCIYEAHVDGLQQLQVDIFTLECREYCYVDYYVVSNVDSLAAKKQKQSSPLWETFKEIWN